MNSASSGSPMSGIYMFLVLPYREVCWKILELGPDLSLCRWFSLANLSLIEVLIEFAMGLGLATRVSATS